MYDLLPLLGTRETNFLDNLRLEPRCEEHEFYSPVVNSLFKYSRCENYHSLNLEINEVRCTFS